MTMSVPGPRCCEICLREIQDLYGIDGDLADVLGFMTPGDAEDATLITEAVNSGEIASDTATCAGCRATHGHV